MSENKLTVTGRLTKVMDKVAVTAKLDKREFVIETLEQYPQVLKFELMNDRCGEIDKHAIGTNIEVSYNLRGREWKKNDGTVQYFVSLNAWRIVSIDREPETYTATVRNDQPQPVSKMIPDTSDDLPF